MSRRRRVQFFNPVNNYVSYEGPTNVLQSVPAVAESSAGEKRYNSSDSLVGFWRFDTDVSLSGSMQEGTSDLSRYKNDIIYDTPSQRPAFTGGESPSQKIQGSTNLWEGGLGGGISTPQIALAGTPGFWNDQVGVGGPTRPIGDTGAFTFAAWIKYTGTNEAYDPRIFSLGNNSIFANIHPTTKALYFTRVIGTPTGGGTNGVWYGKTDTHPGTVLTENQWHHIAISYDSGNWNSGGDSNHPIFYINGKKFIVGNGIWQSAAPAGPPYYPAAIDTYGLQIGNSSPGDIGGSDLDVAWGGSIASIGFWNEVIDETSIASMYAARFGSYEDMSGYISLPARVTLRERDNMTGSYPTVLRTTGRKKPPFKNYFDDERAIVYKDTLNAVYPFILNISDFVKYSSNWQASPSGIVATTGADSTVGQSGGINAKGKVRPFVSDQWLKPSVYQEGEITPFDESRVYLDYTSEFYLTGTSNNVTPGFSSGLGSKINIKIPLNTSSEKKMTRWCTNGYSPTEISAFGGFEYNSGFYYFNFDDQRWEDIGLVDPVTKLEYGTTFFYVGTGADRARPPTTSVTDTTMLSHRGYHAISGHDEERWQPLKSYQFRMSPHTGHRAAKFSQLKDDFAYGSIGAATMAGAAPFAPHYHATGSQVIKMSDYISHPIVLEKAVLRISVRAQMRFGNVHRDINGIEDAGTKLGGSTNAMPYGSKRDFDNYTFFVYRQSRPGSYVRDSRQDVSGSQRYLVMSGCATFYNADAFNTSISTEFSSSALPHSPNFSHNFGMNPSGSSDGKPSPGLTGNYTGSLIIEMTPAVPAGGKWGSTRFALRSPDDGGGDFTDPLTTTPTISIQDFWAGGTTSPALILSGVTPVIAQEDHSASSTMYFIGAGNYLTGYFKRYDPALPGNDPVNYSLPPGATLDVPMPVGTRPLVGFPGRSQFAGFKQDIITRGWTSTLVPIAPTYTTNATSHKSPYVLLPEDEIVIGVDVGVSTTVTSGTYSTDPLVDPYQNWYGPKRPELFGQTKYSSQDIISGSHMIIESGDSSLTLFGSLVKLGVEKTPESGQSLTSDAIHEAIHYDNPVVDQFEINSRSDYLSTYIDNQITGSIKVSDALAGHGVRGVAGSYVLGTADNETGALLRGVKVRCSGETFFDSLMPEADDFAQRSGLRTGRDHNQNLEIVGNQVAWAGVRRRSPPYRTAVNRAQYQFYSLYKDNFSYEGGTFLSSIRSNEVETKEILFGVGWKKTLSDGTVLKEVHYGPGSAKGFLYGIMNTMNLNTSAVFRYDRFGQYRDMLEQRRDGKFMTISSPPQESDGSVNVKFVSAEDGMTPVSPDTTDSINLSTACTSSMPFKEGTEVRVLAGVVKLKYDRTDNIGGISVRGGASTRASTPWVIKKPSR